MKERQLVPSQSKRTIPALADHTFFRYFTFIALYFAQGIPEGMIAIGIPAWMAMNGKTPGEIAAFAIVAVLPWSFKFVVAPLMDRYTYLAMGRKRPWILIGQVGLVVSCAYMAFIPDPLNNLDQLMIAAFIVSAFAAFQDVATDGMAVDIIPGDQQPRANGLMWGSKVCGMSAALAVGSWSLEAYSFKTTMLMLGAVITIIMLAPILLREREGEKMMPWTRGGIVNATQNLQVGNWKQILTSLYRVFTLRNSLMIALLLFMVQGSFKFFSTLLPIFTVKELGWTNVEYAQSLALLKLIGGVLGMIAGGYFIDRFGKKKMLNFYMVLIIVFNIIYAFADYAWEDRSFIYFGMLIQNLIYTFTSITVFAIAMQCCWKKVSASQFTLYMTIANLGQIAFAGLIGPVLESFSWQLSFLVFPVFMTLALLLLQYINIEAQIEKVAIIENEKVIKTDCAISQVAIQV